MTRKGHFYSMTPKIDLTGKVFGRLKVLSLSGKGKYGYKWNCMCSCGSRSTPWARHLLNGQSTSCGCFTREKIRMAKTTHGETLGHKCSAEYNAWSSMWKRCRTKTHRCFADYGGRGITVCEKWKSFPEFLKDMGRKPNPKMSLDRIKNNGNYEPSNCRWAIQKVQCNNKRNNVILELNGSIKTLSEWADEIGINIETLRRRVQKGWPVEKVLTQPLSVTHSHPIYRG